MNVHEYQAKTLMRQFGIPVPQGALATTKAEARQAAMDLGGASFVVKAQIHAGGRGKGRRRKGRQESREVEHRQDMLGMKLVTHQTGPEGKLVRKVWM
jgi:succinyl-CoA synthetase beta subunit